jgi:transposase
LFIHSGGPVSWRSKLQSSVSDSTTEAEYRAIAKCGRHGEWLRALLADFGRACVHPTLLHEDNEACAKWCQNPVDYQRQKHIRRDVHSIRESVQEFRHFDIAVVKTGDQWSDCLTKPLNAVLHRMAVTNLRLDPT